MDRPALPGLPGVSNVRVSFVTFIKSRTGLKFLQLWGSGCDAVFPNLQGPWRLQSRGDTLCISPDASIAFLHLRPDFRSDATPNHERGVLSRSRRAERTGGDVCYTHGKGYG